jgi:uncharacterized protein
MNKILYYILIIFFYNSCDSKSEIKLENNQNSKFITNKKSYPYPKSIGYVNDFVGILDSQEKEILNLKLRKYNQKTSNQIAIIIINESYLTKENFDEFSFKLSNFWGVGTKEKNNGLTITCSPKLRKIRINTGRGTEEILTDEICKEVLNSIIIPELKNENYYKAINSGIDSFILKWK